MGPGQNHPVLFEEYISGVIGDRLQSIEFAKGLIFQLAAYYSYDEVKLVFLYDPEEEKDYYFTKWLPHVWNNDYSFRFIAANAGQLSGSDGIWLSRETPDMRQEMPYGFGYSLQKGKAVKVKLLCSEPDNKFKA